MVTNDDQKLCLSIVIPTLNEEETIVHTLSHLVSSASGLYHHQKILVDAGSSDLTVSKARPLIDEVIVNESFAGAKYKSLNAGAEIATGELILFLDADSLVPDQFDRLIVEHILRGFVGGAFRFKFDDQSLLYWSLQCVNRIRYTVSQMYYGDQGVFCTKQVFDQVGGYPKEPIMEAAYFCRLLRKEGRINVVAKDMVTSARRFKDHGFWKVLAFDVKLGLRFMFRCSTAEYGCRYWCDDS